MLIKISYIYPKNNPSLRKLQGQIFFFSIKNFTSSFFEPLTPKTPLRPIFRVKEPFYRPFPTHFIRISQSRAISWCREKKNCWNRFWAPAFDGLKGQIVKFFQLIWNPQAKLGGVKFNSFWPRGNTQASRCTSCQPLWKPASRPWGRGCTSAV